MVTSVGFGLVGTMTVVHSLFDSLMTNNECVIKEITGQMTSHMYFLSDNKQQAEVSAYRM